MDFANILLVMAISLIGSSIQSSTGFGFGVFVMSVLPFFIPYTEALVLTSLTALVSTTMLVYKHRIYIKFKIVIVPIIAFAVTSTFATVFLMKLSDSMMKQYLGVILILLSCYFLFFSKKIHIKANAVSGATCGGISGVLSALFGMGGPPLALYMLDATKETHEYLANIQCIFLSTLIYISVIRTMNGMVTPEVFKYFVPSLIGVLMGLVLGLRIFKKFNPQTLKTAVYIFMAVIGIRLVLLG